MAKKYNRCRPQKRNIDPRKLDKYREEIARETEFEKRTGQETPANTNLHRYRNPLI